MKKVVSVGLFSLILYHALLHVLVCLSSWWQAEIDLSERLLVYRTVDSLVEFKLPLKATGQTYTLIDSPNDGFAYHGRFYSVVNFEVRGDTVHIAGLEMKSHAFWQSDLLSFLNDHLSGATDTQHKALQFLKLLQKEYSPNPQLVFRFAFSIWHETVCIPERPVVSLAFTQQVPSPPPQSQLQSNCAG
ncbi:hypothetical protein GCM10027341_56000 [Spirosoma knui]